MILREPISIIIFVFGTLVTGAAIHSYLTHEGVVYSEARHPISYEVTDDGDVYCRNGAVEESYTIYLGNINEMKTLPKKAVRCHPAALHQINKLLGNVVEG